MHTSEQIFTSAHEYCQPPASAVTAQNRYAGLPSIRVHVVDQQVEVGMRPVTVLFSVFEARHKPNRPSLVYCADHQSAKEVGHLAYEGYGGPELAYRFERFEK